MWPKIETSQGAILFTRRVQQQLDSVIGIWFQDKNNKRMFLNLKKIISPTEILCALTQENSEKPKFQKQRTKKVRPSNFDLQIPARLFRKSEGILGCKRRIESSR